MTVNSVPIRVRDTKTSRRSVDELGYLLYHCWDLPILQTSNMVQLPPVLKRAQEEKHGLELAKALRKELIDCAEQITQRPRYPVEEIVTAIEKEKMKQGNQELVRIQKIIGV